MPVEVDVLEADVVLDRPVGVDRDRLDAELHQRRGRVGVGDDPLRALVELDGLAGAVRPGESGRRGCGWCGACFGARPRGAG